MRGKRIAQQFLLSITMLGVLCGVAPATVYAQEPTPQPAGWVQNLERAAPLAGLGGIAAVQLGKMGGEKVVTGVAAGAAAIMGIIASLLAWVAAAILFVAGFFLDTAIHLSTYGLSNMVNGSLRGAIDETWKIFRDLVNIGFVFIMLYIAITFILRASTSEVKKSLRNVIIAALLINFSFFLAALVVDVSNQFALSVMRSVNRELDNGSISGFMLKNTDVLGISKHGGIFGNNQSVFSSGSDAILQWGIGAAMSLVAILVLAIVMFIAAFMLIARTLAIIFLLILSPIGFIGDAFPMTKKISKEWWESLVGNAFALPIFLLFIFVAIKLIKSGILGITDTGSGGAAIAGFSNLAAANGMESTISDLVGKIAAPMVKYSIVIGLFVASLYAAKKMHSMGNQALAKLSGSVTATLGGAALGSAAFAGRQSIGRVANWAADKDGFKAAAAKSRLGALALQATRGIGGASFDARGSKTFSGVATATGVGDKAFGAAGGKGGYRQSIKDAREKRTTFAAEAIGQLSDSNPTVKSYKDDVDRKEQILQDAIDAGETKAVIAAAKKDVRVAKQEYNQKKNMAIATYGERLRGDNASNATRAVKGLFMPSYVAGGKTIAKELAKAQADVKYDIIKALKAAKGDKKEE